MTAYAIAYLRGLLDGGVKTLAEQAQDGTAPDPALLWVLHATILELEANEREAAP